MADIDYGHAETWVREATAIVEELAGNEAPIDDVVDCALCGRMVCKGDPDDGSLHDPSCLWRRAKELVTRHGGG